MKKIRIFVVDDHPFFRSGLVQWINQQESMICCGQAGTVIETRKAMADLRPDILLLDLRLGDGDGIDLIPELMESSPGTRIVVLSQYHEDVYAHRALKAGARGYIMKSEATEVVHTAIQTVLRGDVYLSRTASARLLHNLFPDPVAGGPDIAKLSDRELQVFQLLGAGCAPRKIAELLKISPKTVDTYREHLKDKLDLRDGLALLRAATHWVEKGGLTLRETSEK
jgi:DNA-binding NarL/FixJ family response regulator